MIYKNKAFDFVMRIIVLILIMSAIIPFIILVSSSFSSETSLAQYGYGIFPHEFSTAAYAYLQNAAVDILKAYGMSFSITGIGTIISITMTMMFAYALSRPDLPGRTFISFFLFFTMLFNGGFVPTYLVYSSVFNITDSFWAMVVPYLLMNAFYVIMVRTYITSNVPNEVIEAARIDGSGEFRTFGTIVLPMCKPIVGTVALMTAIGYWNNWTNGIYFIHVRKELYGIQNYLNSVLANINFLQSHSTPGISTGPLPSVSIRMALAVIALIPLLVAYPFFQKSFTKGITIGSVKG